MIIKDRVELVKKKGLCFNCFRRSHLVSDFKSGRCTICNQKHHTTLHAELKPKPKSDENYSSEKQSSVRNFQNYHASKVMPVSEIVDVFDENGKGHTYFDI